MDEIEQAVVLPSDARPLNAYGRNYAFSGPNRVAATYLIPLPPLNGNEGCEIVLEEFETRSCTRTEVAEMNAANARAQAAETPAGARRWFRRVEDLPFLSDGRCLQVSVDFDTAAHRVLSVACNGSA